MKKVLSVSNLAPFLYESSVLAQHQGYQLLIATGQITAGQQLVQNRDLSIVIVDSGSLTGFLTILVDIIRTVNAHIDTRRDNAIYCVGRSGHEKEKSVETAVGRVLIWVPKLYSITLP